MHWHPLTALPQLVLLFRACFQLLTSWLTWFRICFDVVDGIYLTSRMSWSSQQLIKCDWAYLNGIFCLAVPNI